MPGMVKAGMDSAWPISTKAGLRLRQDEDLDEVTDGDGRDQHAERPLSIVRMPKRCRASSSSTSRPVMMTAQKQWDVEQQVDARRRCRALRPGRRRRSRARRAASWASASTSDTSRGSIGRDPCPVTTPSRAEITCRKIAIRLATATTQSRPYLNCAPRGRSVPQLPGSM